MLKYQRCCIIAVAGAFLLPPPSLGDTPPDSGPQSVQIDFELVAGNQVVRCGTPISGLGSGRVNTSLRDARFYVSEIALLDRSGRRVPLQLGINEWQLTDVGLLDFEDGSKHCKDGTHAIHTSLAGTVPAADYVGLEFAVGVPENLNHSSTETAPPPLDIEALGWSWQVGRKFLKIEVDPEGGVFTKPSSASAKPSRSPTWFLHLGSTSCEGNPITGETVSCAHSNRIMVRLEDFDAAHDRIDFDIKALFENTDLSLDHGDAVGCMSFQADPDCRPIFEQLV